MEKTLVKGLMVLEALIQKGGASGVSDLAAVLGLAKSNTHRLLKTLVDTGFVRSSDGRYEASLKVWELGTHVIKNYDICDLARPAMTRLVRETAEGVRLMVLDPKSLEVVYLDKIESPQVVRTFSEVGARAPAHCTSSGKVLLAYQDERVIRRASRKLKPYTQWTITNPNTFIRELKRVRADGYAINIRERSQQVSGVAAPIFDGSGNVIAAFSIAAPADRLSGSAIKNVIAALCDAAASVSARMKPSLSNVVRLPEGLIQRRQVKKRPLPNSRR